MEPTKITKQIIGLQKSFFDNTYSAMSVMQDYSETMALGFLKQFPWITAESRKPLDDSFAFFRMARQDYKMAVDQGYDKLAEFSDIK